MKKEIFPYILWMLESIEKIQKYIHSMKLTDFLGDEKTIDACLMQFQHLGEIANRLKTQFPEENSLPYKQMVGFRNFIAHDYLGIEIEEVWDTIRVDLPKLKKQLKLLLKNR